MLPHCDLAALEGVLQRLAEFEQAGQQLLAARYAGLMSDSLFEIDTPKSQDFIQPMPITDDQVVQIRAAFAAAGIDDQEARKALIESCTVRRVNSLRDLYASEAQRVLGRIRSRNDARPKVLGGSAWDNREEETWIDRL